jgi:N-acyl amino acid synthase of PEP-CTERM/exosortase system
MTANVPSREISDTSPRFVVEIARSPEQLTEVFELRHQVYCLERRYENAVGNQETDEFDARARHVLLRDCWDGEVFGTVRLIAPNRLDLADSFPIQRLCEPALLRHLPLSTSGEISRFALSKHRRGGGVRDAGALPRLALIRGIAQLSHEMGLTHWLAVMERSLLRLHQRHAIYFDPVGPLVSYHGLRQPAARAVVRLLDRVKREEFATWNFLTDGGRWCARAGSDRLRLVQGDGEEHAEVPGSRPITRLRQPLLCET